MVRVKIAVAKRISYWLTVLERKFRAYYYFFNYDSNLFRLCFLTPYSYDYRFKIIDEVPGLIYELKF